MKRGLKVIEGETRSRDLMSYNRYPDEKGTERLGQLLGGRVNFELQPLPR